MKRICALVLVLVSGSAMAGEPKELVTAPDAVLCLRAQSLNATGFGVGKSQERLRNLGCLRSPAGVPATLLTASEGVGIWSVRFRPQGMSGGITLYGRPSAFKLPDGSPPKSPPVES